MPRQVDFKVPKINCEDGDEVPYTDCEEAEKIQMITKMTCEVKHTTDCKPVVSTKCGNVQYQVSRSNKYTFSKAEKFWKIAWIQSHPTFSEDSNYWWESLLEV